jgi:hypothetical protein
MNETNRQRMTCEGQAQKMHWRQMQGHTRLWIWTVLGGLMVALIVLLARPALAAIQLSYFYAVPNPSSVILQWGTTSEFNVAGFEVQCKLASEPDTAFHKIDFVPARGGPSTPAQYSFPILSGVEPGVAYCFRLLEITTDGTQGEAPTLCGYGPNVTPTPGVGVIPTTDPNAAPPIATDAFGNPIVSPTPDPFISPVQPVATDAFGNPIPQPQATDAFGNPIPQPVATDAFGNPIPQPVATDAFGSPLPQPVATDAFGNPVNPAGAMFDEFGNPIQVDAFGSPLATPVPTFDPHAIPTSIVITPPPGDPRGNDPSVMQPVQPDPSLAQAGGSEIASLPPNAHGAASCVYRRHGGADGTAGGAGGSDDAAAHDHTDAARLPTGQRAGADDAESDDHAALPHLHRRQRHRYSGADHQRDVHALALRPARVLRPLQPPPFAPPPVVIRNTL